jgi:hypothetical protein
MKKVLISFVLASTVAACASPPSKIAPVSVSASEYAGFSCTQLVRELSTVSAQLTEAERKQRNAVATDAATVFLVLIPVSSMAGDSEGEVALFKGQKIAIEQALSRKSC